MLGQPTCQDISAHRPARLEKLTGLHAGKRVQLEHDVLQQDTVKSNEGDAQGEEGRQSELEYL